MPGKRSTVRQIREILRLHHEAHLGERQIAAVCLVGKGTVQRFLQRAAQYITRKRKQPRSCPRALRQPISSWPRLRRNHSWEGPVNFKVLQS